MASPDPDKVFTAAERIEQLNEIDKDVAQLLRSAGLAVQALTNRAPASESADAQSANAEKNIETQKNAFKTSSSQYFALLSSIDVRLRRQVYALEEAAIIRPEASTSLKTEGTGGTTASAGGNNPLEISWLNSRKDTVGKDKEAELWEEARKFVTRLGSSHQGNNEMSHDPTGNREKEMDLD